jgi:hypothetical protein
MSVFVKMKIVVVVFLILSAHVDDEQSRLMYIDLMKAQRQMRLKLPTWSDFDVSMSGLRLLHCTRMTIHLHLASYGSSLKDP